MSRTWVTPDPLDYSSPVANLYTGFNLDGGINGIDPLGTVFNDQADKDMKAMKLGMYADPGPRPLSTTGETFDALLESLSTAASAVSTFVDHLVNDPGAQELIIVPQARLDYRHHIFVNGINTDVDGARENGESVARRYRSESVSVIHNPKFGMVCDLMQCVLNKFAGSGESIKLLTAAVTAQLATMQRARFVVVHAHSQGALIASNSMGLLPSRLKRSTALLTYGGAAWMVPTGHLALYHAYIKWDDLVPLVGGQWLNAPWANGQFTVGAAPFRNGTRIAPFVQFREQHKFEEGYGWAIEAGRHLLDEGLPR